MIVAHRRWQASSMVTLSDIGLTAKQGRTAVTVWATSLRTAEPLAGRSHPALFQQEPACWVKRGPTNSGLATLTPAASAGR